MSTEFPAETTSEYWAMGAATERERNNEKSLKFVLKRMIGKIKKRQCVLDVLKRSTNPTGMKADSAHKYFEEVSWDDYLANVRGVILIYRRSHSIIVTSSEGVSKD